MAHVPVTTVLAAVAVAAGAMLASATGFGFSLLCAPLLFALLGPVQAVGLLTVLGAVVNALTLATEGRRPRPLRRESIVILCWAVPGVLAGVLVLRSLDAVALQLALTAAVLITLVARRRATVGRTAPAWAGPAAGLAAGALTTATSTAGPPLLTYLLGRGHEPGEVRDTLTLCFLALSPLGAAALLATGTTRAIPGLTLLLTLLPVTVAGHIAGRRVFARLAAGGRYERVLTGALLASLAMGLIGALAG
jgi:uncharacterized membrane protein YfcA